MNVKKILFGIASLLLTLSLLLGCEKNPPPVSDDYPTENSEKTMVIPTGLPTELIDGRRLCDFPDLQSFISEFIAEHEYGSDYKTVGAETAIGGKNIFDGELYALNPDTHFYHRYNKETGTYGEILYAHITTPSRFYDNPRSEIEYLGNGNLSIGEENYKYFIEGKASFSRGYFCVRDEYAEIYCPCIEICGGVCPNGCEHCLAECNNASEQLIGSLGGYADFSNSDGLCPVTEELKIFLQKFSEAQGLFYNGLGWVENHPTLQAEAANDGQWLFDCVFYVKK